MRDAYLFPTVNKRNDKGLDVTVRLVAPPEWRIPREPNKALYFKDGPPDVNATLGILQEQYLDALTAYANKTEDMLFLLGHNDPVGVGERLCVSDCYWLPDIRSYSEHLSVSVDIRLKQSLVNAFPTLTRVTVPVEDVAEDIEAVAQAIRTCRQNLLIEVAGYLTYLRSIILTLA